MNIFEKLLKIQNAVKVTKDNKNTFGDYNYRSAEQIYNAVKPICEKYGAVLHVTDEVVEIDGRPYVKAIAELIDIEAQGEVYAVSSIGWARIPNEKKKLDDSQLTGSASSYADKYAVSKLLLLDDNKDPDSMPPEEEKRETKAVEKWRLQGSDVLILGNDGGYYSIKRLSKRQLQTALNVKDFEGIKHFIEAELAERG
jgi:hypothetical protein